MKLHNQKEILKKRFYITAFSFAVFLLSIITAFAQNPKVDFGKANNAYKSENYEGAIKLYGQLIKEGKLSADVYFNLGNS